MPTATKITPSTLGIFIILTTPGSQFEWLENFDVENSGVVVHSNGVAKMVEVINSQYEAVSLLRDSTLISSKGEPLTLICIAPLTNIAKALELDPTIETKVRRLVMMGGDVLRPASKKGRVSLRCLITRTAGVQHLLRC